MSSSDIPADELMSAAEMRVVREFLGLSSAWLARLLDVPPRMVRRWEEGKSPIPDGVRIEIEEMEQQAADQVGRYVDALMDVPDAEVIVYRSDEEFAQAHPEAQLSAACHRMIIARAAQEVPGLIIKYEISD